MNVLPEDEKFGLVSQIKRATVSVVSNIAEGSGRSSDKDFIRFLDIANGSAFELEAQFYLSFDLDFIKEDILNNFLEKITEVQKLIYGFRTRLSDN